MPLITNLQTSLIGVLCLLLGFLLSHWFTDSVPREGWLIPPDKVFVAAPPLLIKTEKKLRNSGHQISADPSQWLLSSRSGGCSLNRVPVSLLKDDVHAYIVVSIRDFLSISTALETSNKNSDKVFWQPFDSQNLIPLCETASAEVYYDES